jgi:MFS family permease
VAGLIVDRFDSRLLMVLTSGWQAAACLGLAFCTNLALVFPLVFAVGCGSVVGGPTFSALLPRIVGEDRIAAAVSVIGTSNGVAMMAGPGVAGLLYAVSGPHFWCGPAAGWSAASRRRHRGCGTESP